MSGESSQNEDKVKSELDDNPAPAPARASSVKFQTAEQSSPKESSKIVLIKSENEIEAGNKEALPPVDESSIAIAASQTQQSDAPPRTEHGSQDALGPQGSTGSQGSLKGSQDGNKSTDEAVSTSRATSQEQNAAFTGAASRPIRSVLAVTEYPVAEDGSIHINEKQKAAIRRLMHPEEPAENANLGFTKQGKPIKANPYYKYALRAKDGAEDTKPTPAPVTEPHASRLTRRSRRDSTHLPSGPSTVLDKIKEEFCDWLASLGSRRNMTVSKERLEELFSLGLENNLVVRPPEVQMTQPGAGAPPPGSCTSQQHQQQQQQHQQQQQQHQQQQPQHQQQRHPVAAADRRRRKTDTAVVAYCRSPSLTYYPELREKWRQMAISRRRPIWRSGEHGRAPPPPPRVRYGDWYIPIQKWSPLVAGRRLAPPETEEARQLRQRELANRRLNETLSRSHAMSALREYIHICQLQGSSAFPEATPKLVRDVDELVAALALEARVSRGALPDRAASLPMAGLIVRMLEKGQQRQRDGETAPLGPRRPAETQDRGPLLAKPPPLFKPVKTAPGHAARTKRKMTAATK